MQTYVRMKSKFPEIITVIPVGNNVRYFGYALLSMVNHISPVLIAETLERSSIIDRGNAASD